MDTYSDRIGPNRRSLGAGVIGGPTVVIDIGGFRILTDPTFDSPTDYGYLRKLHGPSVPADALGPIDAVLLSHDAHPDNLDHAGRELALRAPLVLTTRSAAERLGRPAQALSPWESLELGAGLTVTAVPAEHGPADGQRDEHGFVNCEVIGFVIQHQAGATVYVSGDNASLEIVNDVRLRLGPVVLAVLFAGAASVPTKFDGRPLSLTASRAVAAAEILGAHRVIVAHQEGWAHFTENRADTIAAFRQAGRTAVLDISPLGHWANLTRDAT